MLGHDSIILASTTQNATVYLWVKRFYAAIHHFRKAGHLGDIDDRKASLSQGARGAPGGDQS